MAFGLAFLWIGQFLINIGVNVGLLPTKGLTLPFLSYGGSSLVICCACVGLLLRIEWESRTHLGSEEHEFKESDFAEGPTMAADGKNVLIMAGGTGGMSSRPWPAPVNSGPWLQRALAGYPARYRERTRAPGRSAPAPDPVSGLRGKGKLSLLKAPFTLVKAVLRRDVSSVSSSRSACWALAAT